MLITGAYNICISNYICHICRTMCRMAVPFISIWVEAGRCSTTSPKGWQLVSKWWKPCIDLIVSITYRLYWIYMLILYYYYYHSDVGGIALIQKKTQSYTYNMIFWPGGGAMPIFGRGWLCNSFQGPTGT